MNILLLLSPVIIECPSFRNDIIVFSQFNCANALFGSNLTLFKNSVQNTGALIKTVQSSFFCLKMIGDDD